MIYNMNRAPKTAAIPSWKFNPFGKPRVRESHPQRDPDAWATFKSLFDRGVFGSRR